jgi:thioredoxin reductase
MQREPIKVKIAIVGCGPVGLFGSLLFQQFGLDFVTVEKLSSSWMNNAPNFHWINASTKVLLKQIPGLTEEMNKYQQEQKLEYYRYYRYVETLFGYQLGITDNFVPNVDQKLK